MMTEAKMKTPTPIPDKFTLREKVAEFLRREISAGKLKSGEKITEIALSKRLGISRTPIRETLNFAFRVITQAVKFLFTITRKCVTSKLTYK